MRNFKRRFPSLALPRQAGEGISLLPPRAGEGWDGGEVQPLEAKLL